MKRLTIGQMAKLNHISEQTLRYYDKMDLLTPCMVDPDTGYRYYCIEQSACLDMIQYMKSLGMALKDVKKHMEIQDPTTMRSILEQRTAQIDAQIRDLKSQKRAIDRTLKSFRHYEHAPPDGTILMEYIEERRMYCVDTGINFYDYSIEMYEKMLRQLKSKLISDHLPQIYFCNAGTILRKENLEHHCLKSTEIFVFVDNTFVDEALTTLIPANTYLCIYCDQFEKEKAYVQRLLEAVAARGCQINGDYICEVLAELPYIKSDRRGMFLRLQIPIKFS